MSYRFLLSTCLATLGLAAAGWGQADGKIAFLSNREGHQDVWIMDADGSDPVNLTQGQNCASPAWSPDGAKIAYIGDVFADGQYGGEIWLMDADGGNPQPLTDDSIDRIRLSWSEDGSSIYYDVLGAPTDDGYSIDSFVMALDGSGSSPVGSRSAHYHSSRSPDGTKEAIISLREKGHEDSIVRLYISDAREDEHSIFLRPISGVEPSVIPLLGIPQPATCGDSPADRLPHGCVSDNNWMTTPTWAPNSMRMAFSSLTRLIWAVDIDGGNLVELTNGLGGRNPVWQPVVPSAAATSVEAQSWGRIKSLVAAP